MTIPTTANGPITRESLARLSGPVIVEFGASTCGICLAFAPHLRPILEAHPAIQHLKIEDGRGRPLGRSFGVTLWPTFVFMKDGQIIQQLVRPSRADVEKALEGLL